MGEAIACLLESRRGWSTCFVAPTVCEALASAHETSASLLLVDTLGIEESELRSLTELRESGGPLVALLVAEADLGPYLDLTVDRVLSRRVTTNELFVALDELSRSVRPPHLDPAPFELSPREFECAQLVARGMTNRRIAEVTGLREQSVKNVVSLAMRKLSVENRVQVALRLSGSMAVVAHSAPEDEAADRESVASLAE